MELSQRATSQAEGERTMRAARGSFCCSRPAATWAQIREKLSCNNAFIDRWSKRFADERVAGLFSRHAGEEPNTLTPELEARVLEWTVNRKPAASTHWSTRKLGEQLAVSHMMI